MENEKRLIDANALLKVLKHRVKGNEDSGIVLGTNSTLGIMEEWVRSIPIVDAVEVVHGRWEKSNYHGFLCCSECKDVYIDKTWFGGGKWNYCPNCGARMDLEVDHVQS